MKQAAVDPISHFLQAVSRAEAAGVDTAAAALATADTQGRPSVRMVLVRHVDDRGFVFHTNYSSRKGRDLESNPQCALCYHWPTLEQQIRVEGRVGRLESAESDAYFATRPRASQIGAWASEQSAALPGRETLDDRYREMEGRFSDRVVPRPPFWGGYRVIPDRIEFWYGRPDRLHDRIVYTRTAGGWEPARLYP
jgi:pyridoxamine 5'-phosphate oxidase